MECDVLMFQLLFSLNLPGLDIQKLSCYCFVLLCSARSFCFLCFEHVTFCLLFLKVLKSQAMVCCVQDTVHRTKLNTLVVFPINGLDMRNHVQKANATTLPSTLSRSVKSGSRTTWKQGRKTVDSEDYLYDLYAVCNHYGDMHGGHYTGKANFLKIYGLYKSYL